MSGILRTAVCPVFTLSVTTAMIQHVKLNVNLNIALLQVDAQHARGSKPHVFVSPILSILRRSRATSS